LLFSVFAGDGVHGSKLTPRETARTNLFVGLTVPTPWRAGRSIT
jgi:hypothetical protein